MKKLLFFVLLAFPCMAIDAQNLNTLYVNGPVKLLADKEYGKNTDWAKIFNQPEDTTRNAEGRKAIVVAPDGSVFMSHKNRHEIWKFGPDGNFQKKIGSKGSKPGQFVMMPTVECVSGNNNFLTSDVGGRLNLFDLNGNYQKTINLKYIARNFSALGNGELLLIGFTVWKGKTRHTVVRLNTGTGNEVTLHDYFIENLNQRVVNVDSLLILKKGHYDFRIPAYGSGINTEITILPDGRFIKSERKTGDFILFNPDGKELLKGRMEIDPVKISEADVEQNFDLVKRRAIENIERYKKMIDQNSSTRKAWSPGATEKMMKISQDLLKNIELFRDIKNYYPFFPLYSNILTDNEGNLLVFEYTSLADKATNRFNLIAFDNNGKRLARTSFVCEDYDLTFSRGSFVFSGGYVYAVAKLKNANGMPLRLVRFKLSN